MKKKEVLQAATLLRDYANYHVRDWDYSRDHHSLKAIKYKGEYSGYNRIDKRLFRFLEANIPPKAKKYLGMKEDSLDFLLPPHFNLSSFIARVRVYLLPKDNLPDGTLRKGAIITFWEEDGEYIQLVQPSVGNLIADFLEQEPEHPHAEKIAAEITRIQDDYAHRNEAIYGKKPKPPSE